MLNTSKNKKSGFTLIELMVVIVIIGILVAIALPNFIAAQDRAKGASVKSNMHTWQTMLETYAVDWGGNYPSQSFNLKSEATSKSYWKELTNPFSGLTGGGGNKGYSDMSIWVSNAGHPADTTTVFQPAEGVTFYDPISNGTGVTKYYIYGGGKTGLLIQDKGVLQILTNN